MRNELSDKISSDHPPISRTGALYAACAASVGMIVLSCVSYFSVTQEQNGNAIGTGLYALLLAYAAKRLYTIGKKQQ